MTKSILLFLAAGLIPATAQIPAFPGAQGFGAHATGGRGGDVYYVTNLNASGPGSFIEGISTVPGSGRTIIFAVSGYIRLPSGSGGTRMTASKVTIAGQTAPGDGIGFYNNTFRISGANNVVRHLRFRRGKTESSGDCLDLDSGAQHTMIDHVAVQFSTDENMSSFGNPPNWLTFQHSLNAWGLQSHSAGGLWDQNHATSLFNLWAHNHTRNPKARPWGLLDWINNVTYDYGIGFIMGDSETPAPWKANVLGNYFVCPPGNIRSVGLERARLDRHGNPNFTIHVADNLFDRNGNTVLDGIDVGYNIASGSYAVSTNRMNAAGGRHVTPVGPRVAHKQVVSNSGPLRMNALGGIPLRDEVDTHLLDNLLQFRRNQISNPNQLPVSNSGFGTLNSLPAPLDSDLDGMPDFWESSLGWNPVAQDHNTALPSSGGVITGTTFLPVGSPAGYTRLEEYLHFLASPHAVVARNVADSPSSATFDLSRYTLGFNAQNPVFTLTNVIGGSATQAGPGGRNITFTPALNHAGRARFEFTVADSQGDAWTQSFLILVSSTAAPRDLIWDGDSTSNTWDTNTPNWTRAGNATDFAPGDRTLFDDRGSNVPAISLAETVHPSAVTVTGKKNYTFRGTGSLASTGSLTKTGDTTLTFARPASFTGGYYLDGGNIAIINGGNLNGGPVRFASGSTLIDNTGDNYLTLTPNISVDAGATGHLILSQRVNLQGSLSGGGNFNIFSPSTLGTEGRVYLDGASAGCSGTVNLMGGGSGRIAFRTNGGSFNGFNNARVNLDGIAVFTTNNSGGNTHAIGSLSGNATSIFAGAYNAGAGATTLNIGGLGLDSVFDGVIRNGNSAITHIIKSGGGTWTLNGTSTYSGNTSLNAGGILLTGSLGNTAMTVANGATLTGAGTIGGNLTLNGGSLVSPGNQPGAAAVLTVGNGLTLQSGCLLDFDLSSNPVANNDQILVQTGSLFQNGSINFRFNLTDGFLGTGTYLLVTGAPNSSVSSVSLTHNLPANARQSFSMGRSSTVADGAKSIWLTVSGTAGNLTWTGSTSVWDIANTAPWGGGPGGDNRFFNLDRVLFNDTPGNRNVTLTGALQPRLVEVSNNGAAYTFGGTGSLTGLTSLVKSGTGELVIANSAANTHAGDTIVQAGTLRLTNTSTPLGTSIVKMQGGTLQLPAVATFLSNPVVFSGTSSIASSYSGNSTIINSTASTFSSDGEATVLLNGLAGILSVNGSMSGFSGVIDFGSSSGMLRLNSNSAPANDVNFGSPDAHFNLGTASGRLNNRNGSITIHLGALSGGPGTFLSGRQSGSGDTSSSYIVGAKNLSTAFLGTISQGGDLGGLNLVKIGSGAWTLGGNSDYIGTLSVEKGAVIINGNTRVSGAVAVAVGATLALNGGTIATEAVTIQGAIEGHGTIESSLNQSGVYRGRGFLTGSPGVLHIQDDAFFADTAALHLRVGPESDLIRVGNELNLAGTLHLQLATGTVFGRFPLFTHAGAVNLESITLSGIPQNLPAHLSTSIAGQVALVIDDADEDGLPDSWEMKHFATLAHGPDDDIDGDGHSNAAEFLAGTSPADGSSFFAATIAVADDNRFTLSWPSVPGKSYEIQSSETLAEAWAFLLTVPAAAAPAVKTSHSVDKTPDRRFYRIILRP